MANDVPPSVGVIRACTPESVVSAMCAILEHQAHPLSPKAISHLSAGWLHDRPYLTYSHGGGFVRIISLVKKA